MTFKRCQPPLQKKSLQRKTDSTDIASGTLLGEDLAAEVILPQTLTFSAMQLTFVLEVDADNPEAFYVQHLTTWNQVIMEQTYSRLIAAKTLSAKETLENGRTNIIFKSGNMLLTFLMNKDKPVRLEMTYIVVES